jgi:hypothetical protein
MNHRLSVLFLFIFIGCASATDDDLIKKGDRFLLVKDIETQAYTTWGGWTGGHKCTIQKDTVIIADNDQIIGASGFSAVPENYEEIEELIIPEEYRKEPYSGYHLIFLQKDIGDKLIPLE